MLAHLSWKLNWSFLIACCPSSVCNFSSIEQLGKFQANLVQIIFSSNEGACLFRETLQKHVNSIFQKHWAKLGPNNPWVKIKDRSNEMCAFKKGKLFENCKKYVNNFKNRLSQKPLASFNYISQKASSDEFWGNASLFKL